MPGADSPSLSPPPPHVKAGKWRSDAVRRRASTHSPYDPFPIVLSTRKSCSCSDDGRPTMPWFSFQMRSRRDPDAARGADSQPRARRARNHAPANRARAVLRGAFGRYVRRSYTRREIASHHTDTGDKPRPPPRTYSYAIPPKNGCSRLVGDGPYLADSTGTTSRNAQNARPSAYIALLPSCTSIRTKL